MKYLANSPVEYSPSVEADCRSSIKILHHSWNPKSHQNIQKSPLLNLKLDQSTPHPNAPCL